MDPDRLTWAVCGLVWLVAVGVLVWLVAVGVLLRSRPTAALGLLVGLAWLVAPAVAAGALWHRGPLIHLLLAAGTWWPRSRVAQVVVIGGYALSASPGGWPQIGIAVVGAGAILLATVRERSVRPLSALRRGTWQTAIALTALAWLVPPTLAWAGLDPRWSRMVLTAYSLAVAFVAVLVVASLRPWTAPSATDLAVDLGPQPVASLWAQLAPQVGDGALVRAEAEEAMRASTRLRTRLAERETDLSRTLTETRTSWERLADSDAAARTRLATEITTLTADRLTHVIDELAQVTVSATGPAAMGAHRAGVHLAQAREQLDSLGQGLLAPALADGLQFALRRLAATATVPVVVDAAEGSLADLPPETVTTAYYVAAETVTNAVKHARAERIRITVERLDGHLELTVVDDGRGGAVVDAGVGLVGLRERVLETGGALDITSPAHGGTEVHVLLPITGAGQP